MKWFGMEVRDLAGGDSAVVIVGGKNRLNAKRRYLACHYWMEVLSVWRI